MPRDSSSLSIDRDKVLEHAAKFDRDVLLTWLGRAVDQMDDTAIAWMIEDFVSIERVRYELGQPRNLLERIRQFHRGAVDGDYYESFNVNSKNYRQKSSGTENFIAAHSRHIDRSVQAVEAGRLEEARLCFELLVDLVRRIDENPDDIVFFADEGGSWQLGIAWDLVLPAWAQTIAALDPEPWADYVAEHHEWVEYHERGEALKAFRASATPGQAAALRDFEL